MKQVMVNHIRIKVLTKSPVVGPLKMIQKPNLKSVDVLQIG